MKKFLHIGCLCCFLFLLQKSSAQIVDMESQRFHRDTTGWSGSLAANLSLSDFGQQVYAVNANAHIQNQNKKNLYLLLGSYGFLKGAQQSFINYGFLHFRYNYKIDSVLRWEAFTQIQENAITKIKSRILIGTGPRFKISGTKKLHLYAASLVMHETDKETNNPGIINQWRNSSYLSLTFLPNERIELTTTTYYQPVLFDIADYRLLNNINFRIKASNKLAVNITWNYQFDSTPAIGITKNTYTFNTGLELDL